LSRVRAHIGVIACHDNSIRIPLIVLGPGFRGGKVVNEIRFFNHDAYNPNGLVDLGRSPGGIPLIFNRAVAEADVRISTGVIETHL
jgi:hypothetical protein